MLRIGMIGYNTGNGHPYSYSAIFNGYDPDALARLCPYELIKEYLPREHGNRVFIDSAKVTHIWTDDRSMSENIARVSLIPNIVAKKEDLIGQVDAVILARDDPWNHLEIAKPFLRQRVPLFIDKQLAATVEDVQELLSLAGPSYPLMAGSAMRFTRDLARARREIVPSSVRSVHGMSRVSWMRYGHHLMEGISVLFGLDIDFVRSLSSRNEHDIVQLQYRSGLSIILEFVPEMNLPIQFTCFSEGFDAYTVPFEDFFFGFREMLKAFVRLVETGERAFSRSEMVSIAEIILAGEMSKRAGGEAMPPKVLESIL